MQRVSIAEARTRLPRLVHDAESGSAIELTRRGKPVAVLLSVAEYEQLSSRPRRNFMEFVREWREKHDIDHNGLEPGDWLPPRDRSSCSSFALE